MEIYQNPYIEQLFLKTLMDERLQDFQTNRHLSKYVLDLDNSGLVIVQMTVFQLQLEIGNIFHDIIVGALAFLTSLEVTKRLHHRILLFFR